MPWMGRSTTAFLTSRGTALMMHRHPMLPSLCGGTVATFASSKPPSAPPSSPSPSTTVPAAAGGSQVPAPSDPAVESAVALAEENFKKMTKASPNMVWGIAERDPLPPPALPENPAEIAKLDNAQDMFPRTTIDGDERIVVIRQERKKARQNPINAEMSWRIYFDEDGSSADNWTNSLMGWASSADPYQSATRLTFRNAAEAVYFCEKRGWKFYVSEPIRRVFRRDKAQYQDNFLPQRVARLVKKEGKSCAHWHRDSACTSHYFRPLNYHGTALAQQHGPNPQAPIVPAPEGIYKMR